MRIGVCCIRRQAGRQAFFFAVGAADDALQHSELCSQLPLLWWLTGRGISREREREREREKSYTSRLGGSQL